MEEGSWASIESWLILFVCFQLFSSCVWLDSLLGVDRGACPPLRGAESHSLSSRHNSIGTAKIQFNSIQDDASQIQMNSNDQFDQIALIDTQHPPT